MWKGCFKTIVFRFNLYTSIFLKVGVVLFSICFWVFFKEVGDGA